MSTRSIIWTVVGVLVLGGLWFVYRGNDSSVGIPNTGTDNTTVIEDYTPASNTPAVMPDENAKG
jgi:hypothetical protein